MRNAQVALKAPIGTIALIMMALFNSFILSSVFGGVGKENYVIPNPFIDPPDEIERIITKDNRLTQNWIGVINFACTDQFISMSMGQVLLIPR